MKKTQLYTLATTCIISYVMIFSYGCGKSAAIAPQVKNNSDSNSRPQILYSMDDTLGNTSTQLWSIATDGTGNKKIAISIPSNLHFDFYGDIAAEVSTDNKTMALSLKNSDGSVTYFYLCNIDGSNIQQISNVNGYLYLQTFINATSILYWKNADNHHNGELWKTNIDGTGNQKINISLPDNVAFGDGKFAKVTADGKTIIFSTFNASSNGTALYKCNIDGTGLTVINSEASSFYLESLVSNTSVLEHSYPINSQDTEGLWLVNLDGSNLHPVLTRSAFAPGLTFGDSRIEVVNSTLFFITEDIHYTQAIYSANLDGSNVKLVTNVPAGYAVKLQGVIQ